MHQHSVVPGCWIHLQVLAAMPTCSHEHLRRALYSSHGPLVVQESDGRFCDLLESPQEAWGLNFSHQVGNNPTVSQCLGPGNGKDQGTLPQLFAQYGA